MEPLIDTPVTICNFFSRLVHRFTHGNAPYSQRIDSFPAGPICPFNLPFDAHPGPVDDAVTDAKNLHRSLLLFIYCRDNPLTRRMVALLQSQTVADEIREYFVFLPLDVTWTDGWQIAASLEFKYMPLLAIVRPRGTSFAESKVFVTYEGSVGESTLIASMRVEHQDRNPDALIVQNQDEEYNRALIMQQESDRLAQEAALSRQAEMDARNREIDEEFAKIPAPVDQADTAVIKFQFPDATTKTYRFSREDSLKWLFVYVRKTVFPKSFTLSTGFPREKIEETECALKDAYKEKQFIVYVEFEDE
jgi:hypothetical protein